MTAWDEAVTVPDLGGFEHLAPADQPHNVAAEMLNEVRWAILNHPRSQQTVIGPSEIGHPCPRFIINKLSRREEPRFTIPWRATVGTALHTWLEQVMNKAPQQPGRRRYITEQRLICGNIGDTLITGSCDLFAGSVTQLDTESGIVWDWKTTNKTHMTEYRRHGVSPKYRVQRHTYGRGYALLGFKVNAVGNIFLMREGELRDTFVDYEPYNEQIVVDAFNRCSQFQALIDTVGVDVALSLYPTLCDDEWCGYCRADRLALPRPTDTADLLSPTPR